MSSSCPGCVQLRAKILANEAEHRRLVMAFNSRDEEIRDLQVLCDDLSFAAQVEKSLVSAKKNNIKPAANAHND